MHSGVQILNFDVEDLRVRLRKMSDQQLREFCEGARYMVSSQANVGKPPLPIYEAQLEEATAEWRRRHPLGDKIVNADETTANAVRR